MLALIGVARRVAGRLPSVREDMGQVTVDPPSGDRRAKGRVVLCATDLARAEEVGRIWLDYVAGRPLPNPEKDQ